MKLFRILLFSTSLFPFQAHAMDPFDDGTPNAPIRLITPQVMRDPVVLTDGLNTLSKYIQDVPGDAQDVILKNIPRNTLACISKKHYSLALQITHEEIYERFLKGVLIYRPQEGSDDGRIELRISDLANPLEGSFDLSKCGDAGQYLSISTGYRKGKKAENENKLEIWFAPRFLIEKELKTTAGYFNSIFGSWNANAPVGIFWTWGSWDGMGDFDYLTTQNMNDLGSENLYNKACASGGLWGGVAGLPSLVGLCHADHEKFHVHFVN